MALCSTLISVSRRSIPVPSLHAQFINPFTPHDRVMTKTYQSLSVSHRPTTHDQKPHACLYFMLMIDHPLSLFSSNPCLYYFHYPPPLTPPVHPLISPCVTPAPGWCMEDEWPNPRVFESLLGDQQISHYVVVALN